MSLADLRAGHRNGSGGGISPYPGAFGAELQKAVDVADGGGTLVPRPEHAIFGLAMLGGGRVYGQAHLYGMLSTWVELGLGACSWHG